MNPALPMVVVILGCGVNVVFLELMVSSVKGAGNLITFAQFSFIATEGFLFTVDFGRKKPNIPLKLYGVLVVMFFSSSVINNWSLKFNIPMPLHMVFKAGSLVTNMIMGMLILRQSRTKYVSVAMVTVGIYICTYTSATVTQTAEENGGSLTLLVGVTMVAVSLVIASCLGIFQEILYQRHGKHSKEAMFYSHAMSLPFFVFLGSDILEHMTIFNKSEPVVLSSFIPTIPKLWFYLIMNVMTQYVCVRSVFILTSECTSLTVTLVITLRKFLSLIFSVLYFRNPFTVYHWIGSLFTFTGSLLFSGLHVTVMIWLGVMKKEKKKEKVDDDGDDKASSVSEGDMKDTGKETEEMEVRQRQQLPGGSN